MAYTNISRHFKVCLLTTTAQPATTGPVWTAVQEAVSHKAINAQHVVAPAGPTSTLVPYVNSLLALHCQLAVTAGPELVDALDTVAESHHDHQFVNISARRTSQANIRDLHDWTSKGVADVISTACGC